MTNEKEKDRLVKSFFDVEDFPAVADWWKSLPEKIPIGYGTYSSAYLVSSSNAQKYIVRITPVVGPQERDMLEHEVKVYTRLRDDPKSPEYISELLYADIPQVYHGRTEYDQAYFIFRYVEGLPLDTLLQSFQKSRKVLTLAKLKDWTRQLLETLAFLQKHGVVHRDIKPANLFVDTTHDRLVIFDFGSACIQGVDCRSYAFYGTRAYASPKSLQLLSHFPAAHEYSTADDLYSVGVILWRDFKTLVSQRELLEYQDTLQDVRIPNPLSVM